MKILLIGEYSNFNNTLKKGLIKLGHEVLLAGRKDGFKSFPVDISFDPTITVSPPLIYLRGLIYRLTKFNIADIEVFLLFWKKKRKLKGFDVVQLINEYPIKSTPFLDKILLKFIFKNNDKVFVSACGNDVTYISYLVNSSLEYHILSPYFNNLSLKEHFKYSLNYLKKSHKNLSDFVMKNAVAYIPADIDYYMAYKNQPNAAPLIPYPINLDNLDYLPIKIDTKIKIFHGINRVNFYKKGNNFFCEALEFIQKKYGDNVEVIEVESIPYKAYINLYNESHILLDQVYAYDQGFNALEAMAKGKVVFTGAEQEWLTYYNLKEDTVAINALPDTQKIIAKLEWLILNPEKIIEISKNARDFIVEHHNYKKVAQQYLDFWQS